MPIAYSAFSCTSAWKSYRPRETMWSHCGERGWYPLDSEGMSPTQVNSIQPRYAKRQRPTFQRWRNLQSTRKKCAYALVELTGVIGEGAFRRVSSMSREIPTGVLPVRVWAEQWIRGNHNSYTSRTGRSEWSLVAGKQGNACGAKRPYFSRVFIKIRRAA